LKAVASIKPQRQGEIMFKQVVLASATALACLSASAQMPASNGAAGGKTAAQTQGQADAVKQLEALLTCKPGTKLTVKDVEAQFQALGLVRSKDSRIIFLPQGKTVIFDDEVLAAIFSAELNESSIVVFFKNKTGKQMAQKFGVTKIDEEANTDEPSYFKQTSKRTRLSISSADELSVGNSSVIKYKSAIGCALRTTP